MKFFSLLCVLALFAGVSMPAYAQSAPQSAMDFLDKREKSPQPTPQQIDESFAVYDACQGSDMVRKYYNCECVGSTFLQMRALRPNDKQSDLIVDARKKCANTVDVAGAAYNNCLEWATTVRSDYESYCTCYANTFAKNFSQHPSDSIRGRTMMMTSALGECSTGHEIDEKRSRWNLLELLKKQGVYDTLFPAAKTNEPPKR